MKKVTLSVSLRCRSASLWLESAQTDSNGRFVTCQWILFKVHTHLRFPHRHRSRPSLTLLTMTDGVDTTPTVTASDTVIDDADEEESKAS